MELVKIINGEACTSSRLISDQFGKEHREVLRAIKKLECSEEFSRRNFAPIFYNDSYNRQQPEFAITRDGFSFLVMGFTGKEAAKFKEEFISAFNDMEKSLMPSENEIILRGMSILQSRVDEYKMQLVKANDTILEQAPIVQYANEVLSSPDLISTTIIAKDLGMSAANLNKILRARGVLYKQAETWVLYSKYQDKGYTHTKTHTHYDSQGVKRTTIHTYWTQSGRQFIHDLLSNQIKSA